MKSLSSTDEYDPAWTERLRRIYGIAEPMAPEEEQEQEEEHRERRID